MPAPIAPIAWTALRIGAVAATAYYVGRKTKSQPKHIWRERALDDTPEGIEVTRQRTGEEANAHGSARLVRTIRLPGGSGVEIDVTTLGRIRFRRTD